MLNRLYLFLRYLPWREIARWMPAIFDTTQRVYRSVYENHSRTEGTGDENFVGMSATEMKQRLQRLEGRLLDQSNHLEALAHRIENLSTTIALLNKRIAVVLVLGVGALLLAAIVLVRDFLR